MSHCSRREGYGLMNYFLLLRRRLWKLKAHYQIRFGLKDRCQMCPEVRWLASLRCFPLLSHLHAKGVPWELRAGLRAQPFLHLAHPGVRLQLPGVASVLHLNGQIDS